MITYLLGFIVSCVVMKASGGIRNELCNCSYSRENEIRSGWKTYGLFRWFCLLRTICERKMQFSIKMEILYGHTGGPLVKTFSLGRLIYRYRWNEIWILLSSIEQLRRIHKVIILEVDFFHERVFKKKVILKHLPALIQRIYLQYCTLFKI